MKGSRASEAMLGRTEQQLRKVNILLAVIREQIKVKKLPKLRVLYEEGLEIRRRILKRSKRGAARK